MRFISDALMRLLSWVREEKGQTLVEYALIVGLVSVAAIIAMLAMGDQIEAVFTAIGDALAAAPVIG